MGSARQGRALAAAAHLAEPVERLALELPAPLLTHAETLSDLAVGLRLGPVEPVAGDDHAAVPWRERREHPPDLTQAFALIRVLPRVHGLAVGDEVRQRRAVVANGVVE